MIVGVGCDIVRIDRIGKLFEAFGDRFLERIYTPYERGEAGKCEVLRRAAFLAKRFAAKEAISKAVGVGIGGRLSFLDMEISNIDGGRPVVRVSAPEFAGYKFHLSMSDERDVALAYVVCEAEYDIR